MKYIGAKCTQRITCGAEHTPGCYNPLLDKTFCRCGDQRWDGQHSIWHCVPVYASAGKDAAVDGRDTYYLAPHVPEAEQ